MSILQSHLYKIFTVATWLILSSFSSVGNQVEWVIERNTQFPMDITEYLFYYNEGDPLSLEEIDDFSSEFMRYHSDQKLDEETVWGILQLSNSTSNDQVLFLELANDFEGGDISGFLFQEKRIIQSYHAGHFLKPLPKDIPNNHNPHIRIVIPALTTCKLLLKNAPVAGYSPGFQLTAYSEAAFFELLRKRDFFQAAFQGIILMLFLYNLILYIQTRNRTYLYYSIYMLGFSLFSIILHGYQYILIDTQYLPLLFFASSAVSTMCYILFIRRFVETKLLIPRFDRTILLSFKFLIGYSSICIGFLILDPQNFLWMDWMLRLYGPLNFLFYVILPIKLITISNPNAKYAGIGALVLAISLSIALIDNLHFENQDTIIGQVGILIELLIFSLGLGNKMKNVEKEKREAQELLINHLKEHESLQRKMNEELEDRVQFNTAKIREQKLKLEGKAKELESKNEQLRKVNAFKNKLFAILGHDLKNPLGTLKGVLELNHRGHLTPAELKDLSLSLDKSLGEILNMLDNILNWAVREVQGMKANKTTIALDMLVCSNIELLSPQADAKNIEIKFISRNAVYVKVDPEMMKLVIRNLLSNAIKYSRQGR